MVKQLLIAALFVTACGGGKKADTTPTDDTSGGGEVSPPVDGNANMVPPEKMEEITRMLDRKQRIMSRCLADAVDATELPKNARGKVTLEIVISPSGSPETVKVIKSSLESQRVNDCVIGHVKSIQFPELPKRYETSYTYGFEAM